MANDAASPSRLPAQTEYLDAGKLADRRKAARLTQEQLAAKVGRAQSRIAHWEAGDDDSGCGIEMIAKLSCELGCEMRDLMHANGVKALAELAQAIQRAPGAVTATAA